MKNINIDEASGFCWGVVQTIEKVENCLQIYKDKQVYVLGEIIHNPNEIERLAKKHLKTISTEQIDDISAENSVIVIRAHGEPPDTYKKIEKAGIELIDATCPLVKRLQEKILKYYNEKWQIIIFGKYNHAEVIGLRGCCNDECYVILNYDEALEKIDFNKKTVLCSQTTMDIENLLDIQMKLKNEFIKTGNENNFVFENTICKFVINREEKLIQFAKNCELVLFVAGRHSSNGKVLFEICKSANQNTIFIENYTEIKTYDFSNIDTVGITGATSTPKWLLEEIKSKIQENQTKA